MAIFMVFDPGFGSCVGTFASIKMIHFEIEYVLQYIFIMQIQ